MTIARVAQDKFEYQDLASLLFALGGLDDLTIEVRSEPTDGEDTEVRTIVGGSPQLIDIQSKDEGVGFDIGRLAHHLAHPSPHKVNETLLDRLEADARRVVVFITGGRLRDDAVCFAAPADWLGQTSVSANPSAATASAFLKAFAQADLGSKTYEARRKAHRQALAARLKPREAQSILRRVVVLDQVRSDDLRGRCLDLIVSRIRSTKAAAEALLDPCLRLVREAKLSGSDLVPALRRLLERNRRRRFGSPDYLARGTEAEWMTALKADGSLLIAGPPRCGKSQSVERLADSLVDEGYEVVLAEDLQEARRLFYDEVSSPRAVLLDDPLGDGWTVQGAPGSYHALKALVAQASPARLLLVAQNQTPLLTAAGVDALGSLRTSGRQWVDLTAKSSDLSVRVWEDYARRAGVPEPAIQRMTSALSAGREMLDLGALTHLALSGEVQEDTPLPEMAATAAQGAAEFGQEIAANDAEMEAILAAFAVATDEAVGIDEATLAFVLNGPARDRPAHMGHLYRIVEAFGRSAPENFPDYKSRSALRASQAERIETLENRRILVRVNERLQLSHGFYRAAALGIVRRPAAASRDRHLAMMQRGLFCLDPKTSRAAARNLPRVWAAVPEAARVGFVTLAADGLSALYPGTRDLCWRFLTSHLDRVPEKIRSDLPQWIRNTYSTDLEDLAWRGGEAWIRLESSGFADRRWFRKPDLRAIRPILDGLEGEGDYVVQPETADAALSYYSWKPRRLNHRAVRRLLALDEAVLRGNAAKSWVSVPRRDDEDILDQIFDERHPRIAREVLDGIADGWPKLSAKRRTALVERMKAFIASPVVAVPLVDSLVLINRVEHFGDDPPWALFGALLPVLLDQLTDEGTGAEPRLFTAVDDAIRHLPAEVIVDICRSWIGWLTRTTRRQLRSDYAWGVVAIVIEATRGKPGLREGLLEPLFAHVDETGAASMLVSELSMEWDELTAPERAPLRRLLRSSRKDGPWLRAIALTRREPSATLTAEILGVPLSSTARGVLEQLPDELLDACIDVHLGVEPFGHLGLSCQGRAPWRRIVQRLASQPDHRLGPICLQALVQQENAQRLGRAVRAWTQRLDEVFDLLLKHHLRVAGGSELRPIWVWAFTQASASQKAGWDVRLTENIVGLIDDLFEFDRHLGLESADVPKTWARLEPDYRAMRLVSDLRRSDDITPEMIALTLPAIVQTCIDLRPVLYSTYDYVEDMLKTPETRENPVWESMKGPRSAALDVHWRVREQRLPTLVVDRSRWRGPM